MAELVPFRRVLLLVMWAGTSYWRIPGRPGLVKSQLRLVDADIEYHKYLGVISLEQTAPETA